MRSKQPDRMGLQRCGDCSNFGCCCCCCCYGRVVYFFSEEESAEKLKAVISSVGPTDPPTLLRANLDAVSSVRSIDGSPFEARRPSI